MSGLCLRLETAIRGLKPTPTDVDPKTNLWAAYNEVAGAHDDDMTSKYSGDLDTILLFVRMFTSLARLVSIPSTPFFLC